MEVIVDTNILIDAIYDQLNNEDCWEILRLIRCKDIVPVVSEGLLREYMVVPMNLSFMKLSDKFNKKTLTHQDFNDTKTLTYQCFSDISKLLANNSKMYKTTSSLQICDEDPDDDKIINLAIDSNCTAIITKNITHFECIEKKNIKTKNGKDILVYKPEMFSNHFKLLKHFHTRSLNNKQINSSNKK